MRYYKRVKELLNSFTLLFLLQETHYKKRIYYHKIINPFYVVSRGFEPRQTEPKTVVLPLHHETILRFILKALQR